MNCKKCNAPLSPDDKFCPNCGEKNTEFGTVENNVAGEYNAGTVSTGEYNASDTMGTAGEYNAGSTSSLSKEHGVNLEKDAAGEYNTKDSSSTGEYNAGGEYSSLTGDYSTGGEYNAAEDVTLGVYNAGSLSSTGDYSTGGEYSSLTGDYNAGGEYNAAGEQTISLEENDKETSAASGDYNTAGDYNASGDYNTTGDYNASGDYNTSGEFNTSTENTASEGGSAFSSYAAEINNPDGGKKKPPLKPVIIGAVAAVAVAGVAFGAYKVVGGLLTSPKDAFKSAVKREANSAVEFVGKTFDSTKARYKKYADGYGYDGDMSLELSDSGKEWLSSTLYIDDNLEWLDKVALRYDGNMKSKAIDLNMTASLNDDDLMEINAYMDEDKMQFMIPDLSDYVLKYDMVDLEDMLGNTSFLDMTEMNSKFADAIPDSKQLKKITDKYIGIFVDNINDVEKSSDEVSAEDIKVKATKLTATITGEELLDIQKRILEQIPEDEELKDIIINGYDAYSEYANMSNLGYGLYGLTSSTGEEVYDSFIESIEEELANLEDSEALDETIEYSLWLSGKNVIAKEITVDGESVLDYRAPMKGSDIAVDFSMGSDYELVRFSGSGEKKGSNITGDFVLEYEGQEINITSNKFDLKGIENGNVDMDLEFSMNSYEDYTVGMKLSGDDKKSVLSVELLEDGDSLFTANMTANINNGNTPEELNGEELDANDESDIQEYISDLDIEGFKEKLEETDLPEEYISILDMFQ